MLCGIIVAITIMSISTAQVTEIILARSNGKLASQVKGQDSALNRLDADPKTVCGAPQYPAKTNGLKSFFWIGNTLSGVKHESGVTQ